MDTAGHPERTLIKVEAGNEEVEQDHSVVHSFFNFISRALWQTQRVIIVSIEQTN